MKLRVLPDNVAPQPSSVRYQAFTDPSLRQDVVLLPSRMVRMSGHRCRLGTRLVNPRRLSEL